MVAAVITAATTAAAVASEGNNKNVAAGSTQGDKQLPSNEATNQ